jgi:hypothetical protein
MYPLKPYTNTEPTKGYLNNTLSLCPRCNHRHQLTKETNYKTEKCPHCNCKLQYNLKTKKYEPKPQEKPTYLQCTQEKTTCLQCTHCNTIQERNPTTTELNEEQLQKIEIYCGLKHTKPEGYNCKDYKKNPNVEVKE